MAHADSELHAGTGFPLPPPPARRPLSGEVRWVDANERIASTSGPAVQLFVDLYLPRHAGDEVFLVARLRDAGGYMPSADPAYVDEHDNLAITAIVQVPLDAFAEQIELVFPYALLPEGVGGLMEVELVAFDQQGEALASSGYSVELPDDVDRSPDVLTVLAHTLVTLARADGPLTREGVRRIRDVLVRDFDLDALGVRFLKRILKIAAGVHHTPVTLAEVARLVVPQSAHARFVRLLYEAAGHPDPVVGSARRFIDALLAESGIHDHIAHGPEALVGWYRALELEPGTSWEDVRTQYRKLVREYHPDRVANLAQGFIDYANQRMTRFNEAYKALQDALTGPAPSVAAVIDLEEG